MSGRRGVPLAPRAAPATVIERTPARRGAAWLVGAGVLAEASGPRRCNPQDASSEGLPASRLGVDALLPGFSPLISVGLQEVHARCALLVGFVYG